MASQERLIDYAISKIMNSLNEEKKRENIKMQVKRKEERERKNEKGERMLNKKDSNDNSVSFVSPRHSINDGGNKGCLMSLRSAAADRRENGDFERKIIF